MEPYEQLEQWRDNGTFARINRAMKAGTPVQIKRSSGEFVTGYIKGWGFGGLMHAVVWGPNAQEAWWDVGADRVRCPDGVLGKNVKTTDLVEWNPWLGAQP